jgi:hypothetical protein
LHHLSANRANRQADTSLLQHSGSPRACGDTNLLGAESLCSNHHRFHSILPLIEPDRSSVFKEFHLQLLARGFERLQVPRIAYLSLLGQPDRRGMLIRQDWPGVFEIRICDAPRCDVISGPLPCQLDCRLFVFGNEQ